MANKKISELPAASTPLTGVELVPLVQNGVTSRVSVNNLKGPDGVRYFQTYATMTAFTNANGRTDNMVIEVASRTTEGDGGGGVFRYSAASVATVNGGTILAADDGVGRWLRVSDNPAVVWVQWFGVLTTASGFTAALRAAITAAGVGGEVHIPYGAYTYNDNFTVLGAQKIIGHGLPFITKAANVAQTFIMTTAARARIEGIILLGAGATYTGTGVYIGADASSFEQQIVNCQIDDFQGPCIHFDGADAGQRAVVQDCLTLRRTTTTNSAIVGTTTIDTAGNRQIINCNSPGAFLVQINKMFNTSVTNCNFTNIDMTGSDTIQTRLRLVGNRIATLGGTLAIYGNDNTVTGNVIAGPLTLNGAASRNHLVGNVLVASSVPADLSTATGDNCNWIDDAEYTFTPTIKADTTDPTLWASTYGRINRHGKTLTVSCGATAGASTTFGSGSYYVQLPAPFAAFVAKAQAAGNIRILDAGAQYYAGTCVIVAGGSRIYMFVTQAVGPTHPMTWANGDSFDLSITFEIS